MGLTKHEYITLQVWIDHKILLYYVTGLKKTFIPW